MQRAGRLHTLRWGTGLLLALLVAIGCQQAISHVRGEESCRGANVADGRSNHGQQPGAGGALAIEDLEEFPSTWCLANSETAFADPDSTSGQKLALAYALARFGQVERQFLLEAIPRAPSEEVDNIAAALARERELATAGTKERGSRRHLAEELGTEDATGHAGAVPEGHDDRSGNAAHRAARPPLPQHRRGKTCRWNRLEGGRRANKSSLHGGSRHDYRSFCHLPRYAMGDVQDNGRVVTWQRLPADTGATIS